MSDAPAVPVVAAAVEAVVPAVEVDAPVVEAVEPPWAKSRTEAPARAALKKLGAKITKDTPIAAGVEAVQQNIDSQKERRRAAEKERDEARGAVADLTAKFDALSAMQTLEPAQRDIIAKLAGTDPVKQLEQISLMKSMLAMTAAAPAAPGAPAPIATPAQSAPAAAGPATPAPPGNPSPKDEYARLKSDPRNQLLAAQYLLDHRGSIVPAS